MRKKNDNKGRKLAAYAFASALVFSSFNFASTTSAAVYKPGDIEAKIQQLKKQQTGVSFNAKKVVTSQKAELKATDKVRVIVEVEGQTPVEFATEQGKMYKELSDDTKYSIQKKIDKQQQSVQEKISAQGVKLKYKQKYSTAFNGFSGEVTYGEVAKIEAIEGVKNVYLANEYNAPVDEPNMKTSHQFIQSRETWSDSKFKGEGMVVAIIDSGVDPSHRDFKLTDTKKERYSKPAIDKLIKEKGLMGHFFTDKVPYGYNYFDNNDTIVDTAPSTNAHGMHVAGIVAANGDEAKGGIKGVAPEAQILAMKVFSNDPLFSTTWTDVYLAAIDDAVKLGADVLNMSLGSPASFYRKNSAEEVAIHRATENGIVCAVSAGNSGKASDGWMDPNTFMDNPYAENPDIGVVGAPGLYNDTLQVGSANNAQYVYQYKLTIDGINGFSSTGKGTDDWNERTNGGKLELVSLTGKAGNPEDYHGIKVKGKVVLVPFTDYMVADKVKTAVKAGAAGFILYGNNYYGSSGGFEIPFMTISKEDGNALEDQLKSGSTAINVSQLDKTETAGTGKMSDFSSWGTTPSLEMKPEITAPGRNIYSTVNNNKYAVKSGTSQATPQVAGGSALVQQYLQTDARFSKLSLQERTHLAKVLLMNTAKVIDEEEGQPYSPRRQGAGMMQIHSAVTSPVYVVNKANGEPKVELKDFQTPKFSMTLTVKNISNKPVTYKVNTDVLTDKMQQMGEGLPDFNALVAGHLEGAKMNAPETITVPAGASQDVTVKVDFSKATIPGIDEFWEDTSFDLRKNIFVEGSVNFEAVDTNNPNLTVPYLGYYGKWDNPKIIDGFKGLGETRFYDLETGFMDFYGLEGATDVISESGESDVYNWNFITPDNDQNAYPLSPNGDGVDDSVNPLPSFLRNAKEVQFNILSADNLLLRNVKTEANVKKDYYDYGNGSFFSHNVNRAWDGKVKGKVVQDGLYFYEMKAVIDYPGAEWQSKKIPVYVDTTAPKVKATYDSLHSVVSWKTVEKGTGVKEYSIYVNGDQVAVVDGNTTTYVLQEVPEKAVVQVVASDYAGNFGYDTAAIGDTDAPIIYITDGQMYDTGIYVPNSPIPYGAYNTMKIKVKGLVLEDTGLKSIKVNGKEVNFEKDEEGRFSFAATATFDTEGAHDIIVQAVDLTNKTTSIARKIFIDITKPVINVTAPERVDKNVDQVNLKVNLKDNFNAINFYVDDNHKLEVPVSSPVDLITPLNKDVQVTVPLSEGENKFILRARDYAGNETIKEVVIKRGNAEAPVWKKENGAWYYYVNGKKATGWVKSSGKWYFLAKDGKMQTGWVKDGKAWYYLTKSGAMATGWVLDGKTWYYLAGSGAMKTGWLFESGKWYYLNNNGSMATGWKLVGGKWYYLYKNGAMAANTTVDGYKLGKDGAWIK